MKDLHAALLEHLRAAGVDLESPPSASAWPALLAEINRVYRDAEGVRAELAFERERWNRELLIAQVLQTSLLPTEHHSAHVEIAATLVPATEVGGDYYDVHNVGDTCWIAIGDVAGHGMRTAMIMLMVQSIVSASVRTTPAPAPSEVLASVNRALWDNIRKRLASDEHLTCTLLRWDPGGRVRYAGAHEEIVISRAAGGPCEIIPTPGTWLAAIPDVAGKNHDRDLHLAPGDVMVLITDGVTEARDASKKQFGMTRLASVIERHRGAPLPEIRDAIFQAVEEFRVALEDDTTVVVATYR
ncbi:MAG: PP2C family protein-serine/threonine phosphatase [Kofleriaceae bacterium]|nr:PP2C family protein-serine/threonine phosphatase [Kofleriaceae bacterium]